MNTHREWSREELRAHAREIAARAPTFTPAQIATLRRLLWGASGQPPVRPAQLRPAAQPGEDVTATAA